MSKEFQIRDGNLIASFDLENEDGDIDFCKLLKVSHGVADEIGMFVDYVATNKIIKDQSKQIADLEAKFAECEKSKESYRLQNEQHHLQLLQFYSRLGVEAFGADIHEKALETLMLMKEEIEEKNGVRRALSACNRQNDEFAEMIKKLESEKEELKQQLAEKDKELAYMTEQAKKFNNEAQKYFEDAYCNDFHKQDKISFAIEQLEKVIKDIDCYMAIREGDLPSNIECLLLDFADKIDNQIKELKGERKVL